MKLKVISYMFALISIFPHISLEFRDANTALKARISCERLVRVGEWQVEKKDGAR